MRLSAKSEYACLALIELSRNYGAGRVKISEIASRNEMPKKYLEQILIALRHGGYVRSRLGPEGGYELAKKPDEITLAEIIRLMDGALAPVHSVSKYFYEKTPIERAPKLLNVLAEIREQISEKLEHTTFADLVE